MIKKEKPKEKKIIKEIKNIEEILSKIKEKPKEAKKEEKKSEKQEQKEDENYESEKTNLNDFSFNINNLATNSRNLATTLKENGGVRPKLEETAKEAKKEDEKEDGKKLYEAIINYDSGKKLYDDRRIDQPEIRVNSRLARHEDVMSARQMDPVSSQRVGMIRETRMNHRGMEDEHHSKYEMTRRKDPTESDLLNSQMEMKEKKYHI